MTHDKDTLLSQLDEEREYLWGLLDDIDDNREIYPGWTKREFFAHMAGWDGIIFETLSDYLAGKTPKRYAYKNADEANEYLVTIRNCLPLDTAKRESEINRFAMRVLLASIPAEQYEESIQFPWGFETFTKFMLGAIEHEHDHAQDILNLTNSLKDA